MIKRLTKRFLLIETNDNVAVALTDLNEGELLFEREEDGSKLKTAEPIMQGHKVAIENIPAGVGIVKYGQLIGIAKSYIKEGAHVHVHNVEDITERLVSERRPRS